jgi:hypothetical protein
MKNNKEVFTDYIKRKSDLVIDSIEKELLESGLTYDCPLEHKFVDGLYIRTIYMPKGLFCTSLIHNTNHPYFILKGDVSVISEVGGIETLKAPFVGETKKGTRRVLRINEDTIWVTVHKTDIVPESDTKESILDAVEKVKEQILEKRYNEILQSQIVNNKIINKKIK